MKSAVGIVIAVLLIIGVLFGGIIFGIAALIAPSAADASACKADWSAGSADPRKQTVVTAIVDSSDSTAAGLNEAAFAVYASYIASRLDAGTVKTAKADRVGAFGQERAWFPATPAADFGTEADPRLKPVIAARRFLQAFTTLMRNAGAGSPNETQAAVQAALNTFGVATSDPTRVWSRLKQANLTTAFTDPSKARAGAVLVNAIQGFAPGGVDANVTSPVVIDAEQSWIPAGQFSKNILTARQAAADAGKSNLFIGDSLGAPIADDLQDAGYATDTQAGRKASTAVLTAALSTPRARTATAWFIELGAYNASTDADVQSWIQSVGSARAAGRQDVYWVLPYRTDMVKNPDPKLTESVPNPLGPIDPIVNGLLAARANAPWLHLIDWTTLAKDHPGWFKDDPNGVIAKEQGTANGQTALISMITTAGGFSDAPDSVFGNCDDQTLDVTDLSGATVLTGPAGAFHDAPPAGLKLPAPVVAAKTRATTAANAVDQAKMALSKAIKFAAKSPKNAVLQDKVTQLRDALEAAQGTLKIAESAVQTASVAAGLSAVPEQPDWVKKVLVRADKALIIPPCDDNDTKSHYGCDGLCANLAAKLQGQAHGYYSPDAKRWAYSMWLALQDVSPEIGRVGSGKEYEVPVGAMMFMYLGENHPGHVFTYVGDGQVVTNYKHGLVVKMPAARLIDEYGGYVGWALPPKSWTK